MLLLPSAETARSSAGLSVFDIWRAMQGIKNWTNAEAA